MRSKSLKGGEERDFPWIHSKNCSVGHGETISTAQLKAKIGQNKKQAWHTDKLFSHVKCTCNYLSHYQWDKNVNPSHFFLLFLKPTGEVYIFEENVLSRSSNGVRHPQTLHTPSPSSNAIRQLVWMRPTEQAHPIHNSRTNVYKEPLQPPITTILCNPV